MPLARVARAKRAIASELVQFLGMTKQLVKMLAEVDDPTQQASLSGMRWNYWNPG